MPPIGCYSQADTVNGHSFSATGYSYDGNDNVTGVTYPSGTSVGYQYDSENRIARVTGNQGKVLAQSFAYHPSGAPTSFRSGNNVLQQFTYDNRYRLDTLSAGSLLSLNYGL